MPTPLLTITQAATLIGRSPSTVRRLIHDITQKKNHPDRSGIDPNPKKELAYKKRGETFTWRIRQDLLLRNFSSALAGGKRTSFDPSAELRTGLLRMTPKNGDILSILEKELELKNQQIEKQWEVIHALNDRLREGNILMGSLQKRLAPPVEASTEATVVEDSTMKSSTESAKADFRRPPRRGFLRFWLR